MKNKVLAMLLALCMVMALLPVSVFATDVTLNCNCTHGGDAANKPESCTQATAETGTAATDKCDACKASVTCNPCTETNCKKDHPATTAHTWVCACMDGDDAACKNDEHTGSTRCTATVSANGDKCDACAGVEVCNDPDCKTSKTDGKHDIGAHTYACACKTHSSGKYALCTNNTATEKGGLCPSCNDNTHRTALPECTNAATANTCKAKGREAADSSFEHNTGCIERCKNDADDATCDATVHTTTCAVYKLNAGTKDSITEKDVEFQVDCDCTANHVDGAHSTETGSAACGEKITVKADLFYMWDVADGDESTTNSNKSTARGTAVTAKQGELDAKTYLCDACAAIEIKDCKGTVNCTAQAHNDNCLSLCKANFNSDNCPNDEGVADAHAVKYVVCADGVPTGSADDVDVFWNDRSAAIAKCTALAQAKAEALTAAQDALDDVDTSDSEAVAAAEAAVTAAETAAAVKYSVRAVHCKKAGVVDSTVVEVEGTTVEPTTDDTKTPEETKAPEKAEDFEDVPENAWYAEELTSLMKKGVIVGSIDGGKYSFKPGDKMSTSMVVVMLSRVLDKGFNTTGADWDKEALAWAAEDGLTEGIEAGEITRKDVVLVMWRAAGSPESEQSLEKFTDAGDLEGDALAAMKWAVEQGIIKGDDQNQLNAKSVIIRSEMVAVIARYADKVSK